MKKILSIIFSLLMAISTFNLFSAMAAPISDGKSAAGIVPVAHSGNINPATVTGEYQFKWDSPDISGHKSYVDILIPDTQIHVRGAINYQSTDGKLLTWWLTELTSDDPDYQLIVKWIAVKGGDNYNTYTYPSPFAYTISVGGMSFTGDSLLLSPPNNGNNTPEISHVVFCLTSGEVPPESSSSSESSSSESSSSESSSSESSSSEPSSSESSSSESSSSESSSSESSSSESSSSESSSSESSSSESSSSESSSSESSSSQSSQSSASVSSSTTISDDPTPGTSDRGSIALYAIILVASGTILFVLNKSKDSNH